MPTTSSSTPRAQARSNAETLKLLRQVHLYFGLFLSPALLFFAFTGAVQTLSLHESAGSSYTPPAALAVWAQIHKKQTWMLPARRPASEGDHREGGAPGAPSGSDHGGQPTSPKVSAGPAPSPATARQPVTLSAKQRQHLPLKIFFLVVSLGLFTSTLTGVYMAYKYDRNKLLVTGLLLAGILIPLVLLPF